MANNCFRTALPLLYIRADAVAVNALCSTCSKCSIDNQQHTNTNAVNAVASAVATAIHLNAVTE